MLRFQRCLVGARPMRFLQLAKRSMSFHATQAALATAVGTSGCSTALPSTLGTTAVASPGPFRETAADGAEAKAPPGTAEVTKPFEPQHLCFFIDTTGSMGNWIAALSQSLTDVIEATTLIHAFDSISILGYNDYVAYLEGRRPPDAAPPFVFSGWCSPNDPKLRTLADGLRADGGADEPEAFKTGLHHFLSATGVFPATGHVHVLVLADAPPHGSNVTTEQDKAERAALKELYDMPALLNAFPETLKRCTISVLTDTHRDALFAYVAARTGGDVHEMDKKLTASNIRVAINQVLNGWFGVERGFCHDRRRVFKDPQGMFTCTTDKEVELLPVTLQLSHAAPRHPLPAIVKAAVVKLQRNDEEYVTLACDVLQRIALRNPAAIASSPILGRMWRAFCNRREDPRRDELLAAMNRGQSKLTGADKDVYAEWIKGSYNASVEVREALQKFIHQSGVQGVIRYHAEDSFQPHAVAEAFMTLDADSLALIVNVLSRLTVDPTVVVPAGWKPAPSYTADEGEGGVPLPIPDGCIPLNLPLPSLFRWLFHTAAPGTVLSKRLSAILAIVANSNGSVVAPWAKEYLKEIRGTWISFKRRPVEGESDAGDLNEGVPDIPENFGKAFVSLVQRHDRNVRATGEDKAFVACTEGEAAMLERIRRVMGLLRFIRVESKAQLVDLNSIDGTFPDHVMTCTQCLRGRSFTIVAADGRCGYCHAGRPVDAGAAIPAAEKGATTNVAPVDPNAKKERVLLPAPESVTKGVTFQVMCHLCRCVYNRDPSIHIPGKSKCHFCRSDPPVAPTPVARCQGCGWQFASENKSFPAAADGSIPAHCAACRSGVKVRELSRITHQVRAAVLFPLTDYWRPLYENLGMSLIKEADGPLNEAVSVINALPRLGVMPPRPSDAPLIPWKPSEEPVLFRDQPVVNTKEIWAQAVEASKGNAMEKPVCNLCMKAFDPSALARSCGRRACEQRLCLDCSRSWYGVVRPGGEFLPRHVTCPFCNRLPSDKALHRGNASLKLLSAEARALVKAKGSQWDASKKYAWCCTCHAVCETTSITGALFTCTNCSAAGDNQNATKVATMYCSTCRKLYAVPAKTEALQCGTCHQPCRVSGDANIDASDADDDDVEEEEA